MAITIDSTRVKGDSSWRSNSKLANVETMLKDQCANHNPDIGVPLYAVGAVIDLHCKVSVGGETIGPALQFPNTHFTEKAIVQLIADKIERSI